MKKIFVQIEKLIMSLSFQEIEKKKYLKFKEELTQVVEQKSLDEINALQLNVKVELEAKKIAFPSTSLVHILIIVATIFFFFYGLIGLNGSRDVLNLEHLAEVITEVLNLYIPIFGSLSIFVLVIVLIARNYCLSDIRILYRKSLILEEAKKIATKQETESK